MAHLRSRSVVLCSMALALLVGCDSSETDIDASSPRDAGPDASPTVDAGPGGPDAGPTDAGSADAGRPPSGDAGTAPAPPPGWPETRAWQWVRSHPMFVSALTVRMGPPPAPAVTRYFDEFNANSIHLWETALPSELDGWLAHRPDARWLTWVHADGTNVGNGMVIGGYAPGAPGRIGYQIGDEPRSVADMDGIIAGARAVRAADPGGLRIVNFASREARENDLVTRFCDAGVGDIISYDVYTRSNSAYGHLAYFRDHGLRCDMPYWRYMKGYRADPGDAIQSESDLRWDAFTGLTYGYTGHSWFLYVVSGGDAENIPTTFFTDTQRWTSPTTERFTWAAQINRELRVYGRAVTQLLSTGIGWATDTPVAGVHPPAGTERFAPGMDPHLTSVDLEGRFVDALFGFFVDRFGDHYVIVQNPNHSDGSFPTDNDDALRATLNFDFSDAGEADPSRVLVLDGRRGTVGARALAGGALRIEVAAGDILFFKYDTGRTFAGF